MYNVQCTIAKITVFIFIYKEKKISNARVLKKNLKIKKKYI